MGSQALQSGLWDAQRTVCSDQQGEGQKWELAGQEPLQQLQAAGEADSRRAG